MPELPEVEVVRRGLAEHVVGRRLETASVLGARVARRHEAGPAALAAALTGVTVEQADRRGKYLWLALDSGEALVVHLGMSGQMLVTSADTPRPKHCHAFFGMSDGRELRFVDQRTFGGLQLVDLVPDPFSDKQIPSVITHIAPDPLEAAYDEASVNRKLRHRHTAVKRALLDQTLVSGIGNIYADEALWRSRLHGERWTDRLTRPVVAGLLEHAREVMIAALGEGGTSFDALYVNVNGASGRMTLDVYGREGRPCKRCGTPIVRERFMNRSSHFCPVCQRKR
ncbi:bifunctional DNA-formamidopyrimidine glycosylase/DNA-(apurinic or apyrimidinic site) lyase [Calidifontibacter sp. DB0510]|uniref:Formamidopyrimidine-DNA glycosylase n=1 Tax=Metallococcus carri TaxID=1656884 RepID=A0A967AZ84_9MICO|nr:bifunctional DNA-formamidopyrimidine glycosylase/DNA-(apurinic or apyrimidinic site) lyase [Metallococcus carri]NHN54463.1 bifunctional DNA-formamidopyrimidine glycosylase/DNA-(apurinic or apyrimidinic site) lyase [Metallococcus carri]NOP36698.1 bifunctional DNA-formamidopyrimidine glycosylase/DNA-(apurinic or apyrimidinic site) lyase [Calidifontibacter sp. DB2511S]